MVKGIDLRDDYARDTLENIYTIWHHQVNLEQLP